MAYHQSAIKRIRQTETRTIHNRFYSKTMRNAVRKFRSLTDKKEAVAQLPQLYTMIDKLAKRGMIHKNKAGNLKSGITKFASNLA